MAFLLTIAAILFCFRELRIFVYNGERWVRVIFDGL
jgi:hypothetical protein